MSIEDQIKASLAEQGIDASSAVEKLHSKESTEEKEPSIPEDRIYTEFEQEQMAKGWKPDGPKSAEEYARTEPLYEEIKARGKQIKQMQKTLDALTEHMSKQEKIAYNKALETLRAEKEDAILRGDVAAVMRAEKEQYELTTAPQQPQRIPEADAFTERYEHIFKSSNFEEMEIATFVMERDKELMARNLTPAEHMKTLEQHMLKKFPSYFGGKETVSRTHQSVETGNDSNVVSRSTKTKFTFHDLNPEQKQVARDFEKYGIMKIDAYIKQLVDLGDLK